jgi:Domain of unknown function (DUF4328)/Protein of unknown function (DUF2510)
VDTGSGQSLPRSPADAAHSSAVTTSESPSPSAGSDTPTLSPATAPEGWHRDPHRHGQLRYWDGTQWTEHISPDPSAAVPATVRTSAPRHAYTSGTARLGMAALLALAAIAVVDAVATGVYLWATNVVSGWIDEPDTVTEEVGRQIDALASRLALVHAAFYLVAAILVITWLYRTYTSERVDSAELKHSPGWVIGAWFVPVLSWWRPLQIVRDLWWAATPESDRARGLPGQRSIPWLMVWWWVSWLAMNLLGWVSLQATQRADELQGLFGAFVLDVVADGVTVVAALLAIAVFGGILRKLHASTTRGSPRITA